MPLPDFPDQGAPPSATDPTSGNDVLPLSHDTNTVVKRGRGLSIAGSQNGQGQRSLHTSASRSQPVADHPAPTHIPSVPRRSPSLSHPNPPHGSRSMSSTRALSRSQSNVSLFQSAISSAAPELPFAPDAANRPDYTSGRKDGAAPLAATNGSRVNVRAPASSHPPSETASPSLSRVPSSAKLQRLRVDMPAGESPAARSQEAPPTTVPGIALESLFNAFAHDADLKIDQCTNSTLRIHDQIEDVCGVGVDQKFDKRLAAMGFMARSNPKALIDKAMGWKRMQDAKAPPLTPAKTPVPSADLSKRSIDLTRSIPEGRSASSASIKNPLNLPTYSPEVEASERRSSVATYILCRLLIDVLSQTNLTYLTKHVAVILEDIAFDGTVNKITREDMERSPMQRAKWAKATELLGVLSLLDFGGVHGRFIRSLKEHQVYLGTKGRSDPVAEGNAHNMLKGMRQLRPTANSDSSWIQVLAAIQALVELFLGVHGEYVKADYCRTIEVILLRTASSSQGAYDDGKWRKVINELNPRLLKLSSKPKYWSVAYSAYAALTCVCPNDLFRARFQQMLDMLPKHLRERQTRTVALKAACRLVWCNLQRKCDSDNIVMKQIDELARALFFTAGRKYSLSRDPDTGFCETLVQLIRVIGAVLPQQCFKSIIFPLMHADTVLTTREVMVQSLDPDRIVIGIRGFLALIGDVETGNRPKFPVNLDDCDELAFEHSQNIALPLSTTTKTRPRKSSMIKGEPLQTPVLPADLPEPIRGLYHQFCEVLAKVIRICDIGFGGQASLDEKFAPPQTPKNVMDPWTFARNQDNLHSSEERIGFYDLLHVAVQALPRCLSSKHPPTNELITLLCRSTAHVEADIAESSAISLKAIARQGWAQDVVDRISAFIFKYESRYATMSDGGMLGPAHIESTLRLYVSLVQVWIDELQTKRSNQNLGLPRLDTSTSQSYVDRVEAQGLFLLCSPSGRVRSFAVEVFELVTRLDDALGETNARVFNIFSSASPPILDPNDASFTVHERARLLSGSERGSVNPVLADLCRSTESGDMTLWVKVFPRIVKAANSLCFMTVSQAREDVCSRLAHLQTIIESSFEERPRAATASTMDSNSSRATSRTSSSLSDSTVDQWKLYLMFACSTITRTEPATPSSNPSVELNHARQASRSSQAGSDSMSNSSDLFGRVIPLLYSDHSRVRAAAATGLSSVNINLYKPLLESLSCVIRFRGPDSRKPAAHFRATSSPRREPMNAVYNIELVQVYESTSDFLQNALVYNDDWILEHLAAFIHELNVFLSRDSEPRNLGLKKHFCGLLEKFYSGLNRTSEPSRWMSFQRRKAIYVQLENWWDEAAPADSRSANAGSRSYIKDHGSLRFATASAMAALCAGPMFSTSKSGQLDQFQPSRILGWIDMMLKTDGHSIQNAGRRALKNLISHNRGLTDLLESTVDKLYEATKSNTLEGYLDVLTEVAENADAPLNLHGKMIGILLFTLGSVKDLVRMKSLRLLRNLEERRGSTLKLRDYDIRVSDKTRAVNVAAQYDLVEEFVAQHETLSYGVFSEYTRHFLDLPTDSQRSMIHIMLPWMKKMELQVDQAGQPTATTYMVLMNMLLITVKYESKHHHELQALWHGLIVGIYPGNAKAIIDFVISLALEGKSERFIKVARQVMVYMASHEKGKGVYEYLLTFVGPLGMRGEESRKLLEPQADREPFFIAHRGQVIESSSASASLSIGQLSLVLLVDLVVEKYALPIEKLPVLLQAVLVLWDHHLSIVQEAAREMLVHMIHVLVISKVEKSVFESRQPSVEDLVELIRRHDAKVVWAYMDNMNQFTPYDLPGSMAYVIAEAVSLFSITVPGIDESLGRTAVEWATHCPVRHQACRSLQIYRCLLTPLDSSTFHALLFQMAGTASDSLADLQAYSTDLIRVVRTIAKSQDQDSLLLPPIFWTIASYLYSTLEWEFVEALETLQIILQKCDLRNPDTVTRFLKQKPSGWDPHFTGTANLIYKGCRSQYSCNKTLATLDQVLQIAPSPLVGDHSRLRLTLLANMPRFLRSYDNPALRAECIQAASTLHDVCNARGHAGLAQTLDMYQTGKFRSKTELLTRWTSTVGELLRNDVALDSFAFTMGLLYNPIVWMKAEVLRLLGAMATFMQSLKGELVAAGRDLFLPLLKLLPTEFCSDALKIIDQVLPLASATSQLPPSIASPLASPGPLTPFAAARDIYGDPGQSGTGWCVPMPEAHKQMTRDNLMSLFHELGTAAEAAEVKQTTPGIEFQKEVETTESSYFPPFDNTNIWDLAAGLDDLDDFFDGVAEDSFTSPQRLADAANDNYDGHERPRFAPSPSSSFHAPGQRHWDSSVNGANGAATNINTVVPRHANFNAHATSADPQIMSPSAFAATPPHQTGQRPSLSRSLTMPTANSAETTPPKHLDTPGYPSDLEPFSDDDALWASRRSPRTDAGLTIRPDPAPKSKFALGRLGSLKRLTGGATAGEKHRRAATATALRTPTDLEHSPQVPKVPDEYLVQMPQSGEP